VIEVARIIEGVGIQKLYRWFRVGVACAVNFALFVDGMISRRPASDNTLSAKNTCAAQFRLVVGE
jgi:hypothetical protein